MTINKLSIHDPGKSKDQIIEQILTEYPKVGKSLSVFWGSKYFTEYIDSIIHDPTNSRKGFTHDTLSNLIKLQALHDEAFPKFAQTDEGWHNSLLP